MKENKMMNKIIKNKMNNKINYDYCRNNNCCCDYKINCKRNLNNQ